MKPKVKVGDEMKTCLLRLITFLVLLSAENLMAQRKEPILQGLYIGLEATNGSRAFQINSDLENLKGLKVVQHGKAYGLSLGNRLINGKLKLGNFSTPSGDGHPIQSHTFELGANFSPFQLINNLAHFFEPYLSVSVETTKINSNGTFIPPPSKPQPPNTCSCQCPTSGGSQLDPDTPVANTPAVNNPVPFSGNFGSTRANIGIGLRAHIQKGKLFLNLFGEAHYGITIGTTASTQALLNTYELNQTAVNVGASIGFIYKKSGLRLRRVNFR